MNQNIDRRGLITREKGPVWKAKVKIYTVIPKGFPLKDAETKLWKIAEILN